MPAAWFFILAAMLTAYAVLDGFDFGAGILHLFVAKTDAERREVLAAIGPVWDGNEVWLIASGGALVYAFPGVYAAAFSGLYLALMVVLWLLVLRGISIEFRAQVHNPLWGTAWDGVFAGASATMALVLGVALANVLRGVPIDATGYFHEDLFASGGARGAIEPYTAAFGVLSLSVLAAHGATFLAWKTAGEVRARSAAAASWMWPLTVALAVAMVLLTVLAQPVFAERMLARWYLWPLALGAVGCALAARALVRRGRDLGAFLASCGFIALLLAATAGTLFPIMLRSTLSDAFTLDAYNAASSRAGLRIGLAMWVPAITLAIAYFVYLFRALRGRATASAYEHDGG
jgi:cytochrome bd ubiquinol oxidase subunit II